MAYFFRPLTLSHMTGCRYLLMIPALLVLFGNMDRGVAGQTVSGISHEAVLDSQTVPATGRQETLVHVSSFGRYAITAQSPQGSALRLIDKLSGPGEQAGIVGEQDGRLDVFLDRGAYKIQVFSHEKGRGTVALSSHPFMEQSPAQAPLLQELKLVTASLDDFQKRSYWLDIKKRRTVFIEAAGRNLADLRLWKDGNWLVGAKPVNAIITPHMGRPLNVCRLAVDLNPGLYLLSAYGGPPQSWAETSDAHPFMIRMGIAKLAETGRRHYTASPFGVDRWLVPRKANYYRLELPAADTAAMTVQAFSENNPFSRHGTSQEISKKSLPPVAEITTSASSRGYNQIIIQREAGQSYILQHFEQQTYYRFSGSGEYWISTVHAGHGEDAVDATAILTEKPPHGQERLIEKNLIRVSETTGWQRRFNLLDPLTLFLDVEAYGQYTVSGSDAKARFRVEPFMIYRPRRYKAPPFQSSGHTWNLEAGTYVLTAEPLDDGKGILNLSISGSRAPQTTPGAVSCSTQFSRVTLHAKSRYTLYLNEQPGVKAGVVLRSLPVNLDQALPVTQKSDEILDVPVYVGEPGTLRAVTEDGHFLDIALSKKTSPTHSKSDAANRTPDTEAWETAPAVTTGAYHLKVRNPSKTVVTYALTFFPVRLESKTPLPAISSDALNAIPAFPVLSGKEPTPIDVDAGEKKTFLVNVDTAALYRLESTGLLQTEGNLRTRTNSSFDREAANGVGRNFLIQQYLREGDYQLTTAPLGESKGHLGLRLTRTQLHDGGELGFQVPARYFLKAGEGLVYRFTIKERGVYHLQALGLNRHFRMRLEDSQGWPLLTPGRTADISHAFWPGDYRFVILPQPVDARVVSLLKPDVAEIFFEGHGPHRLTPAMFDQAIHHVWNEPQSGEKRLPDTWVFTVPAPVEATIGLSDEMAGALFEKGAAAAPVVVGPRKAWQGKLAAGDYRLEVKSVRKNNRLGYRLNVAFTDLVAGHQKRVIAPVELPVSVGKDGLVELYSFGNADVRARLYDHTGQRVARNDDRADDWNFHIAQYLASGHYRLKIEPVSQAQADTAVHMQMPEDIREKPLTVPADITITDNSLHSYSLVLPKDKAVLLAAAGSRDSVMLAVKEKSDRSWHNLGTTSAKNPRLAVTLNRDGTAAYQLHVRSVDQRGAPIKVQVVALSPESQSESTFTRKGVTLEAVKGLASPTGVAAVALSGPGVFRLSGPAGDLFAASDRPQPFRPVEKQLLLANGEKLWLVAGLTKNPQSVKAHRLTLTKQPFQITVPAGKRSRIDLDPNPQGPVLVRAESRMGQPGIVLSNLPKQAIASQMGVGANAAIAVSPGQGTKSEKLSAVLWNADGSAAQPPLPIDVSQYSFSEPHPESLSWGLSDKHLETNRANRFTLPAGPKRIQLTLSPETAAVLMEKNSVQGVQWAGASSITRRVDTHADGLLLLYTGPEKANANIVLTPLLKGEAVTTLDSGRILKTHAATSGSLALRIQLDEKEKASGLVLKLYGTHAGAVITENNGSVKQGQTLRVNDDGALMINHDPGLLMAWLEEGSRDPWQAMAEQNKITVHPPEQIRLKGKSMTLMAETTKAALLHIKTNVPAIAYVRCAGQPGTIHIFSDGADLPVYLLNPPVNPPADTSPTSSSSVTFQAVDDGELSGTADIQTTPVTPIGEGRGPRFRLEPGGARLFSFDVKQDSRIGLGVNASADIATCLLLGANGKMLGDGVVQMHDLVRGRYLLTVRTPPDSFPVDVQPVVVGLEKPGTGPPDEVIRTYMENAGLKPDREE